MDNVTGVGSSLDALISAFNNRIAELQELVLARNMYPANAIADLSAVDATLKTMESQLERIRQRLNEERQAIPKAKKLIERSQQQQKQLQHMLAHMPSRAYETAPVPAATPYIHGSSRSVAPTPCLQRHLTFEDETVAPPKERKGRSPAPRWFVTADELDSLSSYMRGRLTLQKVNIAINEIAGYADANAQLIISHKKLSDEVWQKAVELRGIAMAESLKGKHFCLESDIKGPGLKLDHSGKAVLTVLRHLGRIQEVRVGHHRVIVLMKPPQITAA